MTLPLATFNYGGSQFNNVRYPGGAGGQTWGLTESAFRGQASLSGFDVEDPASAWSIVGLTDFYAQEAAATPTRFFTGYIAPRNIKRGSALRTGTDRAWGVTVADLNSRLGDVIIKTTGKRSAETDIARVNWIIAYVASLTGFFIVGDATHYKTSVTSMMAASDYTGRTPFDVLTDCSNTSGYNFYLYYGGSPAAIRLAYHPFMWASNPAGISISNVASEINGTTVFGPSAVDSVSRSPDRVYSGVWFEYSGGHVWVERAATKAAFRQRETHAVDMAVGKPATAIAFATRYLENCANEEDTMSVHLLNLPAASLNLALPGQRVPIKLTHVESYKTGGYMDIISRTVHGTGYGTYDVTLELRNPIITGFWGVGHKDGRVMTPPPAVSNVGVASTQAQAGQSGSPVANSQMVVAAPGTLALGTSSDDDTGANGILPWFTAWAGSGAPGLSIVADATWPGGNYIQATFDDLGSATTHNAALTSDAFPVRAGQTLQLIITQAALVKAGSTIHRVFTLDWIGGDGTTVLSTVTIADDAIAAGAADYALMLGTQTLGSSQTAPTAASFARLTANVYESAGHNAANYWRWGELSMNQQKSSAEVDFDSTHVQNGLMADAVARAAYASTVLALSPIAYYRLGEASGTTAADESTTPKNGTYYNTPTLAVAGPLANDPNTGVTFASASSEYVEIADDAAWDFGTGNYSIAFWMKRSGAPAAEECLVRRPPGAGNGWGVRLSAGATTPSSPIGAVNVTSGTSVVDGAWHHVVVTMARSGNGTFYIDGAVSGAPTNISAESARDLSSNTALAIGRHSAASGLYFNGSLDEVALFNTALSAAQVTALYTAATVGPLPTGTSRDDAAGRTANLPYFTAWRSSGSATAAVVEDTTWPGGHYAELRLAAVGSATTNNIALTTDPFPIIPAGRLGFLVYRSYNTPAGVTRNGRLTLDFYDAAGAWISAVNSDSSYAGPVTATPGIAPALDVIAPDTAARARITLMVWETVAHSSASYYRLGALFVKMDASNSISSLDSIYDGGGAGGTTGGIHIRDTSGDLYHGLVFGEDTWMNRAAAGVLSTGSQLIASGGMRTKVKAGALGDADFADDADGNFGFDTTNHRLYFREGGGWHYIARTAGFTVPSKETICPVCLAPLAEGDDVVATINDTFSDGALHGVYIHFKCGRNGNHPKVGKGKDDQLPPHK